MPTNQPFQQSAPLAYPTRRRQASLVEFWNALPVELRSEIRDSLTALGVQWFRFGHGLFLRYVAKALRVDAADLLEAPTRRAR